MNGVWEVSYGRPGGVADRLRVQAEGANDACAKADAVRRRAAKQAGERPDDRRIFSVVYLFELDK